MTPTPEQIAAVRAHWPNWTDSDIRRHLLARQYLSALAVQQRRARAYVPQPMVEPK